MPQWVNLPAEPIVCRNFSADGFQTISGGASFAVESPYTGQEIGQCGHTGSDQVDQIVQGAHRAFADWRDTPLKERVLPLFKFRDLLLGHLDELSHLAAAESGKTVAEAGAGILKGVEVIEFALSLENMDSGAAMEVSRGVTCQYRREPLGVVLGIAPFNFPAMVPLWMYPIAMAVGNCFILKPSEKVPLTSCKIAELIKAAGFPAGTFNVVHGGVDTVNALIDHQNTQAVAFVGSTPIAREVFIRATSQGKRALTLGGAKNHLLVVPDADAAIATPGVVSSFTGCAGQRCMAASLMVAVDAVDQHVDAIVERSKQIQLGKDMGAIISRAALEKMTGIIDRAQQEGAKIILDGRGAKAPEGCAGGYWLGPTIIDHAEPEMECCREEIFGPVLTIVRRPTVQAAMELEKNNLYGNATSVFTTNGAVAQYVARTATTGMIGVNIGVPVPREPFSFGGTKASKFGHGDITGASSLDFWSQQKKVTQKWALQDDANWMS